MPATARWAGPMAPAPARRWPNSSAASSRRWTSASSVGRHPPAPPSAPRGRRPDEAGRAPPCAGVQRARPPAPPAPPPDALRPPAPAFGRAGAENAGFPACPPTCLAARQRTTVAAVFVNRSCSHPVLAQPPSFSPREFRDALGMFATGVTIVTARNAAGKLVGLTASSFNSVSLEPPLVLWSLAHGASTMPVFANGSHYAIHVLAADPKAPAQRFATRGIDRWAGLEHRPGIHGAPLLAGAAATFECFNRSRHQEGDHIIFVGEVERCAHRQGVPPLLYHGGKFYTEHPL